jgi:hypothetical protein
MKNPASKPSRARRALSKVLVLAVSLALCVGLMELTFTFVEHRELAKSYHRGVGGTPQPDPRWGWKPNPGSFEEGAPEFEVTGSVNTLLMNDAPFDAEADKAKTRIMGLGDSHTFAVGVSMDETWPRALEAKLNAGAKERPFRGYNAGCYGYNLHQYLLRLIDQGPILRPDYVVVGLSYATDLYDLLPPDRGGWTYGGPTQPRDYFDFDAGGRLELRHWDPSAATPSGPTITTPSSDVRALLGHFATFRALRRSSLALFVGSHITVGGQSLWPNMDVVLEKEVSPAHEYSWRLAEALLLRTKEESERLGARLIVVGIPYLPQVYDEIWASTFGGKESFSRTAAIERMGAFCTANGIGYVDSLEAFRKKHAEVGRWLHHRRDGHPTAEGQAVIAAVIADSGLVRALR